MFLEGASTASQSGYPRASCSQKAFNLMLEEGVGTFDFQYGQIL